MTPSAHPSPAVCLVVLTIVATSASADILEKNRAAYNQAVQQMNAVSGGARPDLIVLSPDEAVRRYSLGPFDLAPSAGRKTPPVGLGARVAVRGNLIVSHAEEMSEKAAPKRLRVYGALAADGSRAFVPLDISSLAASALKIVTDHCAVIPCPVTVYGHVGEIEAERVSNPFSAAGVLTMMIGVVAEGARFHETRP